MVCPVPTHAWRKIRVPRSQVWTAPLEAATIIGLLLWRTGGAYGLPALGVVVVVLPLQVRVGWVVACRVPACTLWF